MSGDLLKLMIVLGCSSVTVVCSFAGSPSTVSATSRQSPSASRSARLKRCGTRRDCAPRPWTGEEAGLTREIEQKKNTLSRPDTDSAQGVDTVDPVQRETVILSPLQPLGPILGAARPGRFALSRILASFPTHRSCVRSVALGQILSGSGISFWGTCRTAQNPAA